MVGIRRNLCVTHPVWIGMKKITLLYFAAGLLAFGAPALRADPSETNQPPAAVKRSPEQRANTARFMQIIGLTRADLKGLTPEERRARIKDAGQKKLAELKQKQTDGTITDQDKSDLALLQKRMNHAVKPKPDAQ